MEAVISSHIYAPTFQIDIVGETLSPLAVTNVSVEEDLKEPAKFDIVLNEGIDPTTQKFTWLDNPVLDPGNKVEIYFGYVKDKTVNFITGTIKSLTPSFPSTGIPTLTVGGFDLSHQMKKKKTKTKYENVTYTDIAKEIAKNYNLKPGKIDDSGKKHETVEMEKDEKDYKFLQKLADKAGFEFYVRGENFILRNRKM